MFVNKRWTSENKRDNIHDHFMPGKDWSIKKCRSRRNLYFPWEIFGARITSSKPHRFQHYSAARDTNFPRNILGNTGGKTRGRYTFTSTLKVSRRQLYEATPCNYQWASNDYAFPPSSPTVKVNSFFRALYALKASFLVTH